MFLSEYGSIISQQRIGELLSDSISVYICFDLLFSHLVYMTTRFVLRLDLWFGYIWEPIVHLVLEYPMLISYLFDHLCSFDFLVALRTFANSVWPYNLPM